MPWMPRDFASQMTTHFARRVVMLKAGLHCLKLQSSTDYRQTRTFHSHRLQSLCRPGMSSRHSGIRLSAASSCTALSCRLKAGVPSFSDRSEGGLAMTARQWEEYLFKEHQAFAVSPIRGLQLFDVLVKVGGSFGPAKLRRIDSLFGCGLRDGEHEDDFRVIDDLQEAHKKFRLKNQSEDRDFLDDESDDEEELIHHEDMCTIEETVKANSSILASLMEYVNLKSSSATAVTCQLEDTFRHCVDKRGLENALYVWKPNLKLIARHGKPVSKFTGCLDLWLVTEILYAVEVTVDGKSSRDASAGVQAGSLLGGALGVPPSTGGRIEAERSKDIVKKYKGGNIPFAVRTVLLRYNAKGELVRDEDGAKKFAVVRGSEDEKFSDPVENPNYNMGDLFEAVPMTNPDVELYIPLEFDVEDAEESSGQQSEPVSDPNNNN